MYDQPHPGEILKEDVIDPLGVTITETAERLGMTRPSRAAGVVLSLLGARGD